MLCTLIKRFWQFFLQLNLYKKSSSNEQTLPKERLATRIYVCTLIVFLFIIAITYGTIARSVSGIEYAPSYKKFLQLRSKYPSTLHCPCSKLGVIYDTFVTTRVDFHQVCSSQFIQQQWIDLVFTEHNRSSLTFDDYRLTLSFFWQLIAGFCVMSYRTWTDAAAGFAASHTFNPVALTNDVIQSQVQSVLNDHINSARIELNRNLLAIRRSASANQMVSALATNFHLRYPPADVNQTGPPKMSPRVFYDCSCLNVEGCPHPATIIDSVGHSIILPGMVVDCLIIDGTLASTLECYYDRSCVSLLHPVLSINVHPLLNDSNKKFRVNSSVEMLLNELMINEMTNEVRYDRFYSQCNPGHCSYSYARQFDVLLILTTIIGIYGVLSFALRLISPLIAARILRRRNRILPTDSNMPSTTIASESRLPLIWNRLRLLSHYVREKLVTLNLFESQKPRTNDNIFREKFLTRIFIFLLICSSIATGVYIVFVTQEQVVTINRPSLATYLQLYDAHPDTLRCPCSQPSVPYGSFLNVTFVLHQVCSSDLVSPAWLKYLTSFNPILLPLWTETVLSRDFRLIGASYFQTLGIFCSLAKSNVEDAQRLFADTRFINDHVLAPPLFIQQSEMIMNSFIIDTQNDFEQLFNWIYVAFSTGYFLTGANTNFAIIIGNDSQVTIADVFYHGQGVITNTSISSIAFCKCPKDSSSCRRVILLYTNGSHFYAFDRIFNGLLISCTPLRGFFLSTFDWWYDEGYLQAIQRAYSTVISSPSSPAIRPLNASVLTEFGESQLKDLFRAMFMETWIGNHTHFHLFYNQCRPIACSYTITQRRYWVVVLLLFISVCGGLKQALEILVPCISKLIFFLIDWWKTRRTQRGAPHHTRLSHIVYKSITDMNFYQTPTTDEGTIQQQRIYTRVYIILLAACLATILSYTAIAERSITKIHAQPSIEDYDALLSLDLNDLNCPCTFISIPYNEFVTEFHVNQFHEVCSRNVIRSTFWDGLSVSEGFNIYEEDFRKILDGFVQTLDQLCIVAQQSVNNSITIFQSSTMLVKQLMSRNQFENEINDTLQRMQRKIPIEFARTLDLIRTTFQGNALMATFPFNWKFVLEEKNKGINASFRTEPIIYINSQDNTSCSCATSHTCTTQAQLMYYIVPPLVLEGLVMGCNLLETVLLSSLSCFYSIDCINEIRFTLRLYPFFSGYSSVQLESVLTRFNVNDTIEILASAMFIESWTSHVSYERFFNQCAPSICTYKYYYRFDAPELLTTFLSVYGGLSLGIRFLVPYLVRMIKNLRNRCRIVPL